MKQFLFRSVSRWSENDSWIAYQHLYVLLEVFIDLTYVKRHEAKLKYERKRVTFKASSTTLRRLGYVKVHELKHTGQAHDERQ